MPRCCPICGEPNELTGRGRLWILLRCARSTVEKNGLNPTDRGKPGSKHHPVTYVSGVPLAATLTEANAHLCDPTAALSKRFRRWAANGDDRQICTCHIQSVTSRRCPMAVDVSAVLSLDFRGNSRVRRLVGSRARLSSGVYSECSGWCRRCLAIKTRAVASGLANQRWSLERLLAGVAV